MSLVQQMTELDRIEWCKNHKCTEEDCEYMREYCHIQEDMYEECVHCTLEKSCKRCGWALNKQKQAVT